MNMNDESIPPQHQQTVDDATQAIRSCMTDIVQNFFEVGRQLTRVKAILEHGRFRTWITQEFGLTERKAQHLMNIYRNLGAKAAIFGKLRPTALYHLSMPSTPAAAIVMVEERILAGERLNVQQIASIIRACQQTAQREYASQDKTGQRLAEALRKARSALSNRMVADCDSLLGEKAAAHLDDVRTELDWLLSQIPSGQLRVHRSSAGESKAVSAHSHGLDTLDGNSRLQDDELRKLLDDVDLGEA